MHLAEELSSDHTDATFRMLLLLLKDSNGDVSYAAAEAIEARKDKTFDHELITSIRSLPRDNRWPVYRAARNYPTLSMLSFLRQCLEEEIQFQSKRVAFDSRNCFYISHSLAEIARSLKKEVKLVAPEGGGQKTYEHFAEKLRHIRFQ